VGTEVVFLYQTPFQPSAFGVTVWGHRDFEKKFKRGWLPRLATDNHFGYISRDNGSTWFIFDAISFMFPFLNESSFTILCLSCTHIYGRKCQDKKFTGSANILSLVHKFICSTSYLNAISQNFCFCYNSLNFSIILCTVHFNEEMFVYKLMSQAHVIVKNASKGIWLC